MTVVDGMAKKEQDLLIEGGTLGGSARRQKMTAKHARNKKGTRIMVTEVGTLDGSVL